ncbi:MAG: hypothetical protein K2L78_06245 [Muribaculaceae bacterium]|nr:hypothetical protein [Muribaculaceae bacterium]
MKKSDDILIRAAHRDGMTVPDGFFEDFAAKMSASLPTRPEAESVPTREIPQKTVWERIRPYVYMAAMFAGIWCMLKMFTMMSPTGVDLSIDGNRVMTEALGDDNFVYDYIIDDVNDRELFEEMWDDSIAIDEMMPVDSFPETDSGK